MIPDVLNNRRYYSIYCCGINNTRTTALAAS